METQVIFSMLDLFKRKLFKIIFWLFVVIALPLTVLMFIGSQRYVYRAEVKIQSTAEVIFPYLYVPDQVIRWQDGVKSLSHPDNSFDRPGDTALLTLNSDDVEHSLRLKIDKILPSTHLITSTESDIFKSQTTWELKALKDHSIVQQQVVCFYGGVGRFLAPFLTSEAEQQLQSDLERLRKTVEAEHGH